jgi:putative ABC transport system permease protein
MFKLALRSVFRHRGRTAMTLAAIVFGVAGLILTGGFVRDIYAQLGEALIHSQSGHLQVFREGYYESGTRSPEKFLIENAPQLQRDIAKMPEVDAVMARIAFSGLLNNGRADWAVVGVGVEPDKEAQLGSFVRIVAGSQMRDGDRDGVLVGQGVAQALKIAPGNRVTLLLNTAEGALNTMDFRVVGVFQSFSKDYDARAVQIPLAAAQELLLADGVNSLVVSLKQTADTERVTEALRARLAGSPLEVKTWMELNDFYEKAVALYDRQFGVLQLIILAMVLLSVANTVNMSVFERVGEFGTMMALGKNRGQIVQLILAENVLLGLIGGALGVLLGAALALVISAIGIPMPPPPNANIGYTASIRIAPSVVAMAFLVGVAATTIAAVWPALRVSRTPVAEALRANV